MTKIKRRRFAILAALSALFCLAFFALWIRSDQVCDVISFDRQTSAPMGSRTQWAISSRAGCIDFGKCQYGPDSYSMTFSHLFVTGSKPFTAWHLLQISKPGNGDPALATWNHADPSSFWNRLGFNSQNLVGALSFDMGQTFGDDFSGSLYRIPFWLPALATLIFPVLVAIHHLRARRRSTRGLCSLCSYDLRSHNPGQKCPECGAEVPSKIETTP